MWYTYYMVKKCNTVNSYINYKCRCQGCKDAWATYNRKLPSKKKYQNSDKNKGTKRRKRK